MTNREVLHQKLLQFLLPLGKDDLLYIAQFIGINPKPALDKKHIADRIVQTFFCRQDNGADMTVNPRHKFTGRAARLAHVIRTVEDEMGLTHAMSDELLNFDTRIQYIPVDIDALADKIIVEVERIKLILGNQNDYLILQAVTQALQKIAETEPLVSYDQH